MAQNIYSQSVDSLPLKELNNEFLKGIQQYPVASRGQTTVKMAVADLMRKKYPCRS